MKLDNNNIRDLATALALKETKYIQEKFLRNLYEMKL